MLRCCLVLSVLLLTTTLAAAQDKIDGKLIIGKWEPATAPQGAKMTMEFTKDEKIKVNAEFNGQKINMEGSYKLDGNKLALKMTIEGRPEVSTTLKVLKLNDKEMVTQEGDKKEETLKRLKD